MPIIHRITSRPTRSTPQTRAGNDATPIDANAAAARTHQQQAVLTPEEREAQRRKGREGKRGSQKVMVYE